MILTIKLKICCVLKKYFWKKSDSPKIIFEKSVLTHISLTLLRNMNEKTYLLTFVKNINSDSQNFKVI